MGLFLQTSLLDLLDMNPTPPKPDNIDSGNNSNLMNGLMSATTTGDVLSGQQQVNGFHNGHPQGAKLSHDLFGLLDMDSSSTTTTNFSSSQLQPPQTAPNVSADSQSNILSSELLFYAMFHTEGKSFIQYSDICSLKVFISPSSP